MLRNFSGLQRRTNRNRSHLERATKKRSSTQRRAHAPRRQRGRATRNPYPVADRIRDRRSPLPVGAMYYRALVVTGEDRRRESALADSDVRSNWTADRRDTLARIANGNAWRGAASVILV